MNVLLKQATLVDNNHKFNNKVVDICIENGTITAIASHLENPNHYTEIHKDNLHVSKGWFDSSVSFGTPGFEERETIENGLKTAALSGFTTVVLNTNTQPVINTFADIHFVKTKAQQHATQLLPLGALTEKSKGTNLAELFDMYNAGAVGFSDYKKAITNSNLLKIALQYTQGFGGLVYSYPQENQITGKGIVNEHETSTTLGLKGNPNLAETLQISRDINILEYAGGALHIPTLSTAQSVALIKAAKAKGLNVTCSVALHNLYLTDTVLHNFNTNYKVLPPLRTKTDCDALIAGVLDGTIDMVTTDHNPLNIELKHVEFDHAAYGSIGLESAFGVLNTLFSTPNAIKILTKGLERFGAQHPAIAVGQPANLTLFNPEVSYTFNKDMIISTSKNSAFIGETLKGKSYGVIANNRIELHK